MAHLNMASLPKHIDELWLQLTKQTLDILSINETRLDDTIRDTLKMIYNAPILPHFDYCSLVCCNCSKTLHKIQNRAARVITGDLMHQFVKQIF